MISSSLNTMWRPKDWISSTALTWPQEVSLILIQFLKDPDLVKYFITNIQKFHLEEDQKFHCNLRNKKRHVENSSYTPSVPIDGYLPYYSPCVPLSCNLPFTGTQWRTSTKMLSYINCLFPGFIILEIMKTNVVQNEVTGLQNTNHEYSPLEDDCVGVKKDEAVNSFKKLHTLHFKERIELLQMISKSNSSTILQGFGYHKQKTAFQIFKNIVDKYDSYDRDTWEQGDWDNMPYMLYNITNKEYDIYNTEIYDDIQE